MDTPSISTVIIGVCTGLALLTPLVKAFSQWHVALRKTSKPAKNATERQSQISNESSQDPWYRSARFELWLRLFMIVWSGFMSLFGLSLLLTLFHRTEPLTTGSAAVIAMACVLLLVGFLKDWNR